MEGNRIPTGESLTPSLLENMRIADSYLKYTEEIIDVTDGASDAVYLKRYLSIRSVLSTTSSFAIRQQEAQDTTSGSEKIGEGLCAEVFDLPGAGRVIKRARSGPAKMRELWRDFGAHLRIYEALKEGTARNIDINIPKPCYFVKADDFGEWAATHNVQLQGTRTETTAEILREPATILVAERILPLPRLIRSSLIDIFCPPELRENAHSDPKNRNALTRVYLGVRRPDPLHHSGEFSLRNFELTLDKMDLLGMDPMQFVAPMAEALAVMHWEARQDAADVEFVLGSAPEKRITARDFDDMEKEGGMRTTWQKPRRMPQDSLDFTRRTVSMWLLDFNQVGRIQLTVDGVKRIVESFWQNDPYYPRPGEDNLWQAFKTAYLARCATIMDSCPHPQSFIEQVEAEAKSRLPTAKGPPKASTSTAPRAAPETSTVKNGKKQRKYASIP